MPFSLLALTVLAEAVARLARSEGALVDRLREAERLLARIRPGDLDADLWSQLLKVRGAIKRTTSRTALQQAAEALIDLLVRFSKSNS